MNFEIKRELDTFIFLVHANFDLNTLPDISKIYYFKCMRNMNNNEYTN